MGPTITMGGMGSGMDVEGLIKGLVGVSRQPISQLQSRAASAKAAVTDLSAVGGLLSKLKDAASALDTLEKVGSYKTSSSNEEAMAITANGNAQPGTYDVEVVQLATAERRYSNGVASASGEFGFGGTLNLAIGSESAAVEIESTDSLNSVIKKINDSGLRMRATSFFDGEEYRLQLRALDPGAENAITLSQDGFDLGLAEPTNLVSKAQDAIIKVDGFEVKSATNNVSQAIPGVSLALKAKSTEPFTVTIQDDTQAMGKKIADFVTAYNEVITKTHKLAGFGSIKATNPLLAGDSALRGITSRMNTQLTKTLGTGEFNTLASIGIRLNNDGTIKLDQAKLDKAIEKDGNAVTSLMAGSATSSGIMDMMRDMLSDITAPTKGLLDARKDGMDARARRFDDQIAREEKRLESLESRLRKTFSGMDATVAGYNAQLAYLQANI
jgi:flagellar hook-associated protein 2